MSSRVIKYTAKLFTNLNNIKKRVSEIEKKTGEEHDIAVQQLYTYFKRDTDVRVNLFGEGDEGKCLTVRECIDRDIQYLTYRCEKDLVGDEKKDRCMELVDELKRQFEIVLQRVESIVKESDITGEFIDSLKNISPDEKKYIDGLTGGEFNNIKKLLYSVEPNPDKYGDVRVKWITYGYMYGKNRKFEDWLPSVVSLFREYDELVELETIRPDHIKWKYYDKKNLNTGLDGLESMLMAYRADKRDYKVYNKATGETIDFAQHRDEVHYTKTYTDPETGNTMTVIVPSSQRSSIYWGWDTKWCTARIDKSQDNIFKYNMFTNYYKDTLEKRLYILKFNKSIYQLHFSSKSFMDESDIKVKDSDLTLYKTLLISKFIRDFIIESDDKDNIFNLLLGIKLNSIFTKLIREFPEVIFEGKQTTICKIIRDKDLFIKFKEYLPEFKDKVDNFQGIICDDIKIWYKDGEIHRDENLPAIIYPDGTKMWFKNGKYYRDNDQPAIIHSDGTKRWFKNGVQHRDGDLPAIEWFNGKKEWYKNGEPYIPAN